MLNTNGKRLATDDAFLAQLAEIRPTIYFQFDGFERETYRVIRAAPDILPEKLRALDRLATIGCSVIVVPAIERGVNEHEVGHIVHVGLQHPAVKEVYHESCSTSCIVTCQCHQPQSPSLCGRDTARLRSTSGP